MNEIPAPPVPQFRVTLFFGPEIEDSEPESLFCVFNVKKRSWKGGVQVVVKLDQEQFTQLKRKLGFAKWLQSWLSHVPGNEREEFLERGQDILAQCICQTKLLLAIQEKLQQENCELDACYLKDELDAAVERDAEHLKSQILSELDLRAPGSV